MKQNKQEREQKLAKHISDQIYDLVINYLPRIEKAGAETEKGEAKVSFSTTWMAYHHMPKIVTKLSFTSNTKDESESYCELEQMSLELAATTDSEEDVPPEVMNVDEDIVELSNRIREELDVGTVVTPQLMQFRYKVSFEQGARCYEYLMYLGAIDSNCKLKGEINSEGEFAPDALDKDFDFFNKNGVCMSPRHAWQVCGEKDKVSINLQAARSPDGKYYIGFTFESKIPNAVSCTSCPCSLLNSKSYKCIDDAQEALYQHALGWINKLGRPGSNATFFKHVVKARDALKKWLDSCYPVGIENDESLTAV